MIEELATVVAIKPETVIVESKIKSTCSSCQQVKSCGSGQVAQAIPHRKLTLELDNDFDLELGDEVVLAIPEQKLLSSALIVYLLPLIGLISFSGIMQFLLDYQLLASELWVISFGIIGGYLGFLIARFYQRYFQQDKALLPRIQRVISKDLQLNSIN